MQMAKKLYMMQYGMGRPVLLCSSDCERVSLVVHTGMCVFEMSLFLTDTQSLPEGFTVSLAGNRLGSQPRLKTC